MTERNMAKALEEAKRVVGLIEAESLTEDQKEAIMKESIANFNENVNPGWLEYRKSVSTDAAFIEWEDEGDVFRDLHGTEFIDCLGGFGIFACGHGNPEITHSEDIWLTCWDSLLLAICSTASSLTAVPKL